MSDITQGQRIFSLSTPSVRTSIGLFVQRPYYPHVYGLTSASIGWGDVGVKGLSGSVGLRFGGIIDSCGYQNKIIPAAYLVSWVLFDAKSKVIPNTQYLNSIDYATASSALGEYVAIVVNTKGKRVTGKVVSSRKTVKTFQSGNELYVSNLTVVKLEKRVRSIHGGSLVVNQNGKGIGLVVGIRGDRVFVCTFEHLIDQGNVFDPILEPTHAHDVKHDSLDFLLKFYRNWKQENIISTKHIHLYRNHIDSYVTYTSERHGEDVANNLYSDLTGVLATMIGLRNFAPFLSNYLSSSSVENSLEDSRSMYSLVKQLEYLGYVNVDSSKNQIEICNSAVELILDDENEVIGCDKPTNNTELQDTVSNEATQIALDNIKDTKLGKLIELVVASKYSILENETLQHLRHSLSNREKTVKFVKELGKYPVFFELGTGENNVQIFLQRLLDPANKMFIVEEKQHTQSVDPIGYVIKPSFVTDYPNGLNFSLSNLTKLQWLEKTFAHCATITEIQSTEYQDNWGTRNYVGD